MVTDRLGDRSAITKRGRTCSLWPPSNPASCCSRFPAPVAASGSAPEQLDPAPRDAHHLLNVPHLEFLLLDKRHRLRSLYRMLDLAPVQAERREAVEVEPVVELRRRTGRIAIGASTRGGARQELKARCSQKLGLSVYRPAERTGKRRRTRSQRVLRDPASSSSKCKTTANRLRKASSKLPAKASASTFGVLRKSCQDSPLDAIRGQDQDCGTRHSRSAFFTLHPNPLPF